MRPGFGRPISARPGRRAVRRGAMRVLVRRAFFCAGCAAALVAAVGDPAGAAPTGTAKVVAVAGTGSTGARGDGGPATKAELSAPGGIVVDVGGDVAIADSGNCRVQMIAGRSGRHFAMAMTARHIYTVAGTGCAQKRSAAKASLLDPTAVAFDAKGDLLIADASGNRIFELPAVSGRDFGVTVEAGRLTSVAGTGTAGSGSSGKSARSSRLSDPRGIAVDAAGDLYIADTGGCRVEEVPGGQSEATGVSATMLAGHLYPVAGTGVCGFAGDGGSALSAQLWAPTAVTVDGSGDLLIADEGNSAVREVAAKGGMFYGVAISAGNIGTVAGQGAHSDYLADGLSAAGPVAVLNFPTGVATDGAGDLFIADSYERAVREVPAHDGVVFGRSVVGGDMYTLVGILAVASSVASGDGTRWITSRVVYPYGVAVGPSGDLYFSDQGANTIRRVTGS